MSGETGDTYMDDLADMLTSAYEPPEIHVAESGDYVVLDTGYTVEDYHAKADESVFIDALQTAEDMNNVRDSVVLVPAADTSGNPPTQGGRSYGLPSTGISPFSSITHKLGERRVKSGDYDRDELEEIEETYRFGRPVTKEEAAETASGAGAAGLFADAFVTMDDPIFKTGAGLWVLLLVTDPVDKYRKGKVAGARAEQQRLDREATAAELVDEYGDHHVATYFRTGNSDGQD